MKKFRKSFISILLAVAMVLTLPLSVGAAAVPAAAKALAVYDGENVIKYSLTGGTFVTDPSAYDKWTITGAKMDATAKVTIAVVTGTDNTVVTLTLKDAAKFVAGETYTIQPKAEALDATKTTGLPPVITVKVLPTTAKGAPKITSATATEGTKEITVAFDDERLINATDAGIATNWAIAGIDGANLGKISGAVVTANKVKLTVEKEILGIGQKYIVTPATTVSAVKKAIVPCEVAVTNIVKATNVKGEKTIRFYLYGASQDVSNVSYSVIFDTDKIGVKGTDGTWTNFTFTDASSSDAIGQPTSIKTFGDNQVEFTFDKAPVAGKTYKIAIKAAGLKLDGDKATTTVSSAAALAEKTVILLDKAIAEKPIDANEDYNTPASIKPVYSLKVFEKKVDGSDDTTKTALVTKASDITVWSNGGSAKIAGSKDKVDYKAEIVIPAVKSGNTYSYYDKATKKMVEVKAGATDVDMTPEWLKGTGKAQSKKFKWFTTDANVTNPMMAYLSKAAQSIGKGIAGCSNGKLTAGSKVLAPTKAKVWAFDENGEYGVAEFWAEVAPNAVFVGEDLSKAVFVNGKPDANTKKTILTSKIEMAIGETITLQIAGLTTLNPKDPADKAKIALSDYRHGVSEYTYSAGGKAEDLGSSTVPGYLTVKVDGDKVTVTANKLKAGKATSAKFDIVCTESQKKTSVTVSIKNPIVGMAFTAPTIPTYDPKVAPKFDIAAAPAFAGVEKGVTDKIDAFVVKGSTTDAEKTALINGLFTAGKYKKPSTADYKAGKITVKADKSGTKFSVSAPKGTMGEFAIMAVCNTFKDAAGNYSGIFFYDFKIGPVYTVTLDTSVTKLQLTNVDGAEIKTNGTVFGGVASKLFATFADPGANGATLVVSGDNGFADVQVTIADKKTTGELSLPAIKAGTKITVALCKPLAESAAAAAPAVANNTATITLTGGKFRGTPAITDFTFAGTNSAAITGTVVRTSDTVVTITLTTPFAAVGSADNKVTVKATALGAPATSATLAFSTAAPVTPPKK